VLSLAAGDFVYRRLGGVLPLREMPTTAALPLTMLVIVSVATYLILYALSLWWRGLKVKSIFAKNWLSIALSLIGPIPLVIVAALLHFTSMGGFAVLVASLVIMAIGATELGRSQLKYRDQFMELQSLSTINYTMRTYLDLNTLIDAIHEQVASLLDINTFTLALFDPTRKLLTFPLVVNKGERINVASREPGRHLIDHVIQTKAPLMLVKPVERAKSLGLKTLDDNRSAWLGVPLLAPDRALGCIAVSASDPYRKFSERDQQLLVTVASQASIAIENAQLYYQVQRRAAQLTRLNKLSAQLSDTLDPQAVLDMVARSASSVANAMGSAVFMWRDETHSTMVLVRSWGLNTQFTSEGPMPLWIGPGTQPILVTNAATDPQARIISAIMLRHNIRAWIEIPIFHGEIYLGVLVIYYHEARQFSNDEIELLTTFANQSALAISNSRLYRQTDEALERRIQQLSALATINKELSSMLTITSVFNLVLDRAIEATKSSHGILLLNDAQAQKPVVVASRGEGVQKDDVLKEYSVVGEAYNTGNPSSTHNVSSADGFVSQLGVPIVRNTDVLGVIMLVSRSVSAYPPDEISFVSQLGTQATIAMDNARLFEWIQESRNRLQVILDSMQEAVIMFELDGTVALANPRVEALLGLDPARFLSRRITALLEQRNLQFAKRLGFEKGELPTLFGALEAGTWESGGRFAYRLDQPKIAFIDRTIAPVHDQGGKIIGLLMVFADATEERELALAREDLSRMIVHDLRSPLTAINASMKLLGEMDVPENGMGGAIHKTTEISQRALRKLLHLVDSLLDIAKMESGSVTLDVEPHHLRPIAESVRTELLPLAEELDIQVDVDMTGDLPKLFIDSNKIERVLLNLVDNALKFTPVGGLIQIRAHREGEDRVRVEVADNGPGIPDDYKETIFDRFQQIDHLKGNRRGTGLGLTFCQLTIEAHGGSIWIEDNPGGGSIFAFTLPLEPALTKTPVKE
jgi:K+-sensing histidine kinase KdpD